MQAPKIPGIRLEVELGRGAHSVVFKARQGDELCAVKLPQTRARWTREIYREAVALARVTHPSLPAVLEVGEVEGLPYLVMELVEGETLADTLREGALEPEEVIAIAEQLASVLGAVHDVGLVHRDVKPRNILIDSAGALKLVDFGFTTPMERTGIGETAGTAAYAAPEQLVPPGRVDARSDLFCVGRVLLECLIGPSFSVFRTSAESFLELITSDVPPALAQIVRHLLQSEPSARYADAHALAQELQRVRAGSPILGPKGYLHERGAPSAIARTAELTQIVEELRGLRGAGRLVLLRGVRGSGKTRLIEAIERSSRSFARTALATCVQGDAPLATLRRILESCWVTTSARETSLTTAELAELVGNLAPVAALISPRLGRELDEMDAADDAYVPHASDALNEGAAEILLRLAERFGRLVIAIDDLQWMDLVSANALVRVAYRLREAPLSLVLGGRSDPPRIVLDRFMAMRDIPTTDIELQKLTENGVGRLVASYLATKSLDPAAIARVAAMADGTPLGVLEVLGAFLDSGTLRPHARGWLFDPSKIDGIELPNGALALLGRRLAEIPAATRHVLEGAAICGTTFSSARVAGVLDLPLVTVAYAMVAAHRAGVVDAVDGDQYQFIHDSLRETLVDELLDTRRRRLHHRLGELLSDVPSPTFEDLCASARHFASGDPESNPARVYEVARAAASAADERFDTDAALEFYRQAVSAALQANLTPAPELHVVAAEALLRAGSVDESLASFEKALAGTQAQLERARLLGRISWAYETQGEPDRAWEILGRAFEEIGERLPVEDLASAFGTTRRLASVQVARFNQLRDRPRDPRSSAETDLLCQLHYQNTRLASEYGKVGRIIQSGLVSRALSTETKSRATKARAQAVHACVVAALGRHEAGVRAAREALRLAKISGDPTASAFCTQMLGMTESLAGAIEDALANFGEVVDTYGVWMEVPEYCLVVMSIDILRTLQGRADDAWHALEKALERLRRSQATARTTVCVVHRARTLLATMDRPPTPGSWLAHQLQLISLQDGGRGYHRIMSWGPRAMFYLESDDLGADFERLVTELEAEKMNPRTSHAAMNEFYLAVAYARLRQCFRAPAHAREHHVRQLARASVSLRAAARIPLLAAHATLIEGCLAWFRHDSRKATKLLAEADEIATREGAPWVLSELAQARAHFLRSAGKREAARDLARVAETLSREHGALARARMIREEFDLGAPMTMLSLAPVRSSGRSSSRTTRQLAALLNVAKGTRRDIKIEQHAASILDELLRSMHAARGAIWFQPEVPSAGTAVSRNRQSDASVSVAADSPLGSLLRSVHRSGVSWPSGANTTAEVAAPEIALFDATRTHVVPLHLYEQPVGALAMERGPREPPFGHDDRQLLELLAHQVPITLEIARLLFEREQLHVSLQQAQKMEAIGQLAGGLAHDFNNMLAAMRVALSVAQERAVDDPEMSVELDIIGQATTRASQLTSQLLSFARNQPLPMSVQDINQLITKIEPMLRRVATDGIELTLRLSPVVDAVEIDPGSFDQVLMNLLINARDAMPKGGRFTVATRNVTLDENGAMRLQVAPGAYVEVEVADTGEGMTPETLARIFEPFFTTKASGRGTGLGLATVYGFAKNSGGGIEVESETGKGTHFHLYLKRAERMKPSRPATRRRSKPSSSVPANGEADTILVVDDDNLVRRSIAKILERNGYRVIAANGSAEAMDVARTQGKRIGLVIMDVLLPGVTGPELGRRLYDLDLGAKLLFVSGFSAESAPIEDAKVSAEMLLQKPFSQSALLERVRKLMPS